MKEIFLSLVSLKFLMQLKTFEHSHQKTLAALSQLPKGTWSASDWLDDDGISDDMIKMAVKVSITDSELLLIIMSLLCK
ncbi:MAG: hypothetical protein CM15mP85_24670 [Rhodobacterales bacterium]|nr:MAG: hypothetical protein CM15mP85_24670 [Rhodobacterales bacterium]